MFKLAVIFVGVGLCLASALPAAQEVGSLTEREIAEREIANTEALMALNARTAEVKQLQEKLAASENSVARLQKSLAIATGESEVFRRQAAGLKLKMEALGVDSAGGNTAKLEQRLLKAVNDLSLVDEERKALQKALVGLSEAVLAYQSVTVSTDPDARLAVESEMRGASKALGISPAHLTEAAAQSSTITDGMVISVKDELALVVANLGTTQGVKVGMPFEVIRNNQVIGTVRIVDAREKIAGAVIQNLNSDKNKIAVGDRLRVEARN